jgi:hypothetical protein
MRKLEEKISVLIPVGIKIINNVIHQEADESYVKKIRLNA